MPCAVIIKQIQKKLMPVRNCVKNYNLTQGLTGLLFGKFKVH